MAHLNRGRPGVFIEVLDGRRLMAAHTGLDPTFGDNGRATLTHGFDESGPFTGGAHGAIYVFGYDLDDLPYVAKLKANGQADPHFGRKGYAPLPFTQGDYISNADDATHEPTVQAQTLAYDGANGFLYVATTEQTDDYSGQTAHVTRLTSTGKVDTSFGVDGSYSYRPAVPDAANPDPNHYPVPFTAAQVLTIDPLADGSAVLGIDAQSRPDDDVATQQSLTLVKLRPNGKRDLTYGSHGYVQLASGTIGVHDPDAGRTPVDRAFFDDVQTDSHGVTHVLMRYEAGVYDNTAVENSAHLPTSDAVEATAGKFQIKSRTVSATGVNFANAARSWTLFDTGADVSVYHAVRYVGSDGDAIRAIVSNGDNEQPQETLYTLRAGHAPKQQMLDFPDLTFQPLIVRAGNGQYLAYASTQVTRLNSDFSVDRTFAVHGVGYEKSTNFLLPDAFADDEGRLVINAVTTLERFA